MPKAVRTCLHLKTHELCMYHPHRKRQHLPSPWGTHNSCSAGPAHHCIVHLPFKAYSNNAFLFFSAQTPRPRLAVAKCIIYRSSVRADWLKVNPPCLNCTQLQFHANCMHPSLSHLLIQHLCWSTMNVLTGCLCKALQCKSELSFTVQCIQAYNAEVSDLQMCTNPASNVMSLNKIDDILWTARLCTLGQTLRKTPRANWSFCGHHLMECSVPVLFYFSHRQKCFFSSTTAFHRFFQLLTFTASLCPARRLIWDYIQTRIGTASVSANPSPQSNEHSWAPRHDTHFFSRNSE